MEKINSLRDTFAIQETEVNHLDITRTPYPIPLGTRHPLTLVKNEIIDIFSRLGFSLAEGPEVEDDWHVFSSMNFAEDHPARDMQDTFFVEAHPDIILRTHTSSVQARVMEKQQPPIRVLCPGRVYRNEAISSRCSFFLPRRCLAKTLRFVSVPPISPSLSPVQRWTYPAPSARARVATCAKAPVGWKSSVAAWYTPTCSKPMASTLPSTKVMPSVWASNASPISNIR